MQHVVDEKTSSSPNRLLQSSFTASPFLQRRSHLLTRAVSNADLDQPSAGGSVVRSRSFNNFSRLVKCKEDLPAPFRRAFTLHQKPALCSVRNSLYCSVQDVVGCRKPATLPRDLAEKNKKTYSKYSRSRGKYSTSETFRQKSGWFRPSIQIVLSKKLRMSVDSMMMIGISLFYFQHKKHKQKRYIGYCDNLCNDLVFMISSLYEKEEDDLNPLEMQLIMHHPNVDDWKVRAWKVMNPENLYVEHCQLIIQYETLQPKGLNEKLNFRSKEDWTAFCYWYTQHKKQLPKKRLR